VADSLRKFFSFCGEIESISFDQSKKEAHIVFKTSAAAKTATMLKGFVPGPPPSLLSPGPLSGYDVPRAETKVRLSGQLDGSSINVTSAVEADKPDTKEDVGHHGDDVTQESKPR
jgi:hypothetical protein